MIPHAHRDRRPAADRREAAAELVALLWLAACLLAILAAGPSPYP